MNKIKLCVSHFVGSRLYKFVGVKLSSHSGRTETGMRTKSGSFLFKLHLYKKRELLIRNPVQAKQRYAGYQNKVLVNELEQMEPTLTRRPHKKHRGRFFIRQLSEKSKTLYFAKDVVTLVERWSYTPKLHFGVYDQRYKNFVVPKIGIQKLNKNEVFVTSFGKSKATGGSIFSLDSNLNQLLFVSNHFYRLSSHRKLGYLYGTNLNKMSFLSSDLANLGLSIKTYLLLKQKGIHKIGSLVTHSQKYLLQLLNKDKEMFAEVRRCFLLLAICGDC